MVVARLPSVGLGLWMPQILKGFGFGVVTIGFLAAIPYVCGAIAMMLWARLSDAGGVASVNSHGFEKDQRQAGSDADLRGGTEASD